MTPPYEHPETIGALMLDLLRDHGALSRAELGDRLEVPRSRTASEVDALAEAGMVRAAGPRLVHVQVSGSDRGAPGADHIDWDRWISSLTAAGYAGTVCLESFTGENEAIAVAAAIWRPLASSQDALARNGLAHLRTVMARQDVR